MGKKSQRNNGLQAQKCSSISTDNGQLPQPHLSQYQNHSTEQGPEQDTGKPSQSSAASSAEKPIKNEMVKNNPLSKGATIRSDRVQKSKKSSPSQPDLDEANLQVALALSLGLPLSKSSFDDTKINDERSSGNDSSSTYVRGATSSASKDQNAPLQSVPILSKPTPETTNVDKTSSLMFPNKSSRIMRNDPKCFSGRVRTWYESATSCNVADFHRYMWDPTVTTESDKKRWLSQSIQFKEKHDDNASRRTKTGSTPTNDLTDTSSLLAAIISGPAGEFLVFLWCSARSLLLAFFLIAMISIFCWHKTNSVRHISNSSITYQIYI